jgi:hypothetical protein
MKVTLILTSLIGSLLLASISSLAQNKDVITDYDKDINFQQFKTYQLALIRPEEQANLLNEFNQKRLYDAVLGNLGLKGMSLSEEPDVLVAYGVNIDVNKGYTTQTFGVGGYGFEGGGVTTGTESNNYVGKITIAILEVGTKKLLWYGLTEKEIEGDPSKSEKTINKLVSRIFETFPIDQFKSKSR